MQQANTTAPESIVTESSVPKTPLTVEGTKFIRELITTTERNAGNGSFAATQVARFRLLGTIIAAQGNDEYTLGVHDSNILFANRSLLELSRRETLGLIFSALVDFPSENTPLWHWYAAIDGFSRSLLPQLSLAGSTAVRTGALFAMRLVAEPLTSSPPFSRSDFLNSWFSPKMPSALKAAALGYLGECGIEDDLPAIRQEFDRGDYQTTGAAVDAIVRVSLRESRDKAIKALYDLQPASIERNLLSALFGNSASIATNLISEGVSHKNPEIRRVSVRLLTERGALDVKEAERLLSDSDAIVRFEALQSLLNRGRSYSDGDVRQILVKSAEHGLGLLGSFHPSFDIAGEECFKQFREQRLRAMTDDELERLAVQETVLDRDAQFTLIERHFSIRGDELRKSVDNQFRAEFAAALNEMSKSFGSAADDLLSKTKSIEEQVRKGFTRKALDIICRNGDPQDLSRVRQLLGSGFVGYSDLDVEYLRKFGEWQDIPLVIDLVEGPSPIFTLTTAETKYRASARAIYSLGRSRLPELLALAMPSRLLSHLIVEASDKGFRLLDDPSIFALLFSQHDEVRKAAVLKCIRSLPKNRLKKLLDGYLSSDGLQYYNVIYWLDFGISAPRDRAVKAVQRTAARTWSG
jgi:hypothetical protein